MTEDTLDRIHRLFYRLHLAPSQIDRRLRLNRGTARAVIADTWKEGHPTVAMAEPDKE